MIECKICGYRSKHTINQHIKNSHQISVKEYKKEYNAEVYSKEFKQKISENVTKQMKKRWADKEYKTSHLKKLHSKEVSKKISQTLQRSYKNEKFKIWNFGLTKETDKRVKKIGRFNAKNLKGRTKENYAYLKRHSIRMKKLYEEGRFRNWNPNNWSNEKRKNWKEKISKTLAEGISVGRIIYKANHYKNGWYEGLLGRTYYHSGLEFDSMIFLDSKNLFWTKNHKIKIEYHNEKNELRNYIPDFLVKINNIEYIIEMKGRNFNDIETKLKEKAAKIKYQNYFIFQNLKDLKEFIDNEINKDKKN